MQACQGTQWTIQEVRTQIELELLFLFTLLNEHSPPRVHLMSPGPQPVTVTLTAQDRADLEAVTRKATSSQRDGFRARIILLAANGYNNTEIAVELSCTRKTVRKWRGRFADAGRAGLADASRPGRPPIYDDAVRAHITALACELPTTHELPLSG
ncbi:helix-turn-helix domain-containing protein [Natrialba swarupiae]|nr:helix-turn-helix domain-containing protein [Natrialba swarupiae]